MTHQNQSTDLHDAVQLRAALTMFKRRVARDGIEFYPVIAPYIQADGVLTGPAQTALAIISPLPKEANTWLQERDFLRHVVGLGVIKLESPVSQQPSTIIRSEVIQLLPPNKLLFAENRKQVSVLAGIELDGLVDDADFNVVACRHGTFTYKTILGVNKTVALWIPANVVQKSLSFSEYLQLSQSNEL